MAFKRPGFDTRPSSGVPTSTPVLAPSWTTKLLNITGLREEMKEAGVLEMFDKLPAAATTMMFRPQKIHGNGGEWRLRVGYINVDNKRLPLWAHMTRPCNVEWRYGVNSAPALSQRDDFELVRPLCFLYTGPKAAQLNDLDTTVAFYFVAAGKWPGFLDGGRQKVSLKAMVQACKLINKGTKEPHRQPAYLTIIDATTRETFLEEECDAKEEQVAGLKARANLLIRTSAHFGSVAEDLLDKTMTKGSIGSFKASHGGDMAGVRTNKKEYEKLYGQLQ